MLGHSTASAPFWLNSGTPQGSTRPVGCPTTARPSVHTASGAVGASRTIL